MSAFEKEIMLLKQQLEHIPMETPLPKLFTNREASAYLRMSEVTLWRERSAGRLGFRRCANKILYTLDHLNSYLETVKNAPATNVQS